MFSENEFQSILQRFPKFELCYELITHKKVYEPKPNVILAIPEGNKSFAWFTKYKNENVCFILELNDNKYIVNIQQINICFMDCLSLGTIFYGTIFNTNINYFCIEDMYYYAGKYCNYTYLTKLETFKKIFKNDLSQIALTNKSFIFGLPLMSNDLSTILKEIPLLPYNISEVKFRFFNTKKILVMKYFKPNSNNNSNNNSNTNHNRNDKYINHNKKEAVFKIVADIEPDIYNLVVSKNGVEEYYDVAFIPDYKTSVMMNKLFRNIKENDNLDAIEESDDEEEFQDNRADKFVYLDRSFNIKCEYNHKFKRWMPISLAE